MVHPSAKPTGMDDLLKALKQEGILVKAEDIPLEALPEDHWVQPIEVKSEPKSYPMAPDIDDDKSSIASSSTQCTDVNDSDWEEEMPESDSDDSTCKEDIVIMLPGTTTRSGRTTRYHPYKVLF